MEMHNSPESLVDVMDVGPVTVVSIRTPSLSDSCSAAVADVVRAVSRRSESPNILLDFHCVEHLSIAFVSEIKEVVEEIQIRGGNVRCCSLRKEMLMVLEILGLDVFYAGNSVQHAVMRYIACLKAQKQTMPEMAASGRYSIL